MPESPSLAGLSIHTQAVLAGGAAGPDRRGGAAHHLLAYKIDAFTDLEQFKDDMDAYLKRIREAKTAPGHDRVFYAGLPEHEEEGERLERGLVRRIKHVAGGVQEDHDVDGGEGGLERGRVLGRGEGPAAVRGERGERGGGAGGVDRGEGCGADELCAEGGGASVCGG